MSTEMHIGTLTENRWEIHNILQGGLGIVYVVYDNKLSEPLAAKTFRDEVFEFNPNIADNFRREALVWLNLDVHPNITQARFVETVANKPFLFLEYISGGDLRGIIGRKRLTDNLPLVLQMVIQVCDGMNHAIAKGLGTHGDIKPRNCLIAPNETLKLTDFGLARMIDDLLATTGEETRGGFLANLLAKRKRDKGRDRETPSAKAVTFSKTPSISAGSPPFMAPEMFDDRGRVGIRSDIYSTGVMLYQMLTGELPFFGRTHEDYKRQHKNKPLPKLPSHIDPALNVIIRQCLAKDPESRFSNFAELRDQLTDIYERITRKSAPQPVMGKELDARQWHEKGISLVTLGHLKEGVVCFDKAVETDPGFDAALVSKGMALADIDHLDKAIESFSKALDTNPENGEAWNGKGELLIKLGQYDEAIECFDRALELNQGIEMFFDVKDVSGSAVPKGKMEDYDPDLDNKRRTELLWRNKGKALLNLGMTDEALASFRHAVESNQNDAHAWFNIAYILGGLDKIEEEIACLDRATEIDGEFIRGWINKGLAYSRIDQPEKSFECFEHALAIDPRSEQALYNKGAVLVKVGWFHEAIICFETVLALNPNHADAWMGKGFALAAKERNVEAVKCFTKAQELGDHTAAAAIEKYSKKPAADEGAKDNHTEAE